jgi:iron uptake system component EfeO
VSRRSFYALLAAPLVLAACSSDSKSTAGNASGSPAASGGGVQTIEVTLTDDGCQPRSISAQAGPTTFKIHNEGSAAVTEFEVLDGGTIKGEAENVIPGADKGFSITLKAGSFTTKCPNGSKFDSGTLEVADAPTGSADDTTARDTAVDTYLGYVQTEADKLVTAVGPFAQAVTAGDVATAKNLLAAAREHYESIEPIAESFGDLDPAIDAREGDVPDEQWGGFHRIEKALFADGNTTGMGPVAGKLVSDIASLQNQIKTIHLEPAQIANGAVELLNEMSTSKITGEEDRYSHTDLSDFAANLAGSKAAFQALEPLLGSNTGLSGDIDKGFAAVQAALDPYKSTDPVGNGYALFTTLTPDQTKAVSTALDGLADPMSKLAAAVI